LTLPAALLSILTGQAKEAPGNTVRTMYGRVQTSISPIINYQIRIVFWWTSLPGIDRTYREEIHVQANGNLNGNLVGGGFAIWLVGWKMFEDH
jgi:hypothetical protein